MMFKLIKIWGVITVFMLLSACHLVVDEEEYTQSNNIEEEFGQTIIGYIAYEGHVQNENLTYENYTANAIMLEDGELAVGERLVLEEHTIETEDNQTVETISAIYYFNPNSETVMNIALIVKDSYGNITYDYSMAGIMLRSYNSEASQSVGTTNSVNDVSKEVKFKVTYKAAPLLKNYQIIEYNQNQEKIHEETLTMTEHSESDITINLHSDTTNFMVIKTIMNYKDEAEIVNEIYSKVEATSDDFSLIEHVINEDNKYHRYQINFNEGGE